MSTPKRTKAAPTPMRDKLIVHLPQRGERLVIEHHVGGGLAGTLSMEVKSAAAWMVAAMAIHGVEVNGSLPDPKRLRLIVGELF